MLELFVLSSSKNYFLLICSSMTLRKCSPLDPCHTRISSGLEGTLSLLVKENQALVAPPCSRCIHWEILIIQWSVLSLLVRSLMYAGPSLESSGHLFSKVDILVGAWLFHKEHIFLMKTETQWKKSYLLQEFLFWITSGKAIKFHRRKKKKKY